MWQYSDGHTKELENKRKKLLPSWQHIRHQTVSNSSEGTRPPQALSFKPSCQSTPTSSQKRPRNIYMIFKPGKREHGQTRFPALGRGCDVERGALTQGDRRRGRMGVGRIAVRPTLYPQNPPSTLQRQHTEILKQIFPEKEYRGLSPNFHIHASVCNLYIPTIGCLFCWRKYVDRSWD